MLPIHDIGDFHDLCQRLSNGDPDVDIVSLTEFGQGNGYLITDQDSRSLAQCLEQSSRVTEIYINITKLSVRGGIALMPFIMSSSNLQVLGLQGSSDAEEEDLNTQTIVVEVLTRAALQNLSHLTLDLQTCPIARSTLMACVLLDSHLSAISIDEGRLIEDNKDPIFEELSYSTDLKKVIIVQDGDSDDVSEFLFNCLVYLPRNEQVYFTGHRSIPVELTKNRSLQNFSYLNRHVSCTTEAVKSIMQFIENADSLDKIFLHLLTLSQLQKDEVSQAFRRNHSLTSVWQNPFIGNEIYLYCDRNNTFLQHWQDMKIRIQPSIFAFAAEVATKSSAGRSSLYKRLPELLVTKAS